MKEPSHDQRLQELGQKLQDFYDSGYVNRRKALLFAFLKGVVGGLGAFIGGTIVIALVLWLLSRFGQLPFIGHIAKAIQQSLRSR